MEVIAQVVLHQVLHQALHQALHQRQLRPARQELQVQLLQHQPLEVLVVLMVVHMEAPLDSLVTLPGVLTTHLGVLATPPGVPATPQGVLVTLLAVLATYLEVLVTRLGALATHLGVLAALLGVLATPLGVLVTLLGFLATRLVIHQGAPVHGVRTHHQVTHCYKSDNSWVATYCFQRFLHNFQNSCCVSKAAQQVLCQAVMLFGLRFRHGLRSCTNATLHDHSDSQVAQHCMDHQKADKMACHIYQCCNQLCL